MSAATELGSRGASASIRRAMKTAKFPPNRRRIPTPYSVGEAAVVGSIIVRISVIFVAGKPLRLACS